MIKKPGFWIAQLFAVCVAMAIWSEETPTSRKPDAAASDLASSAPEKPRDRGNFILRMLQ